MSMLHIGAGGWAYFKVPGMDSLTAYSKVFDFGGILKVTKAVGLASLKSVLEEDAVFPATKSELIEKQGWKVFDLTENERVHARLLLEKLPDRKYVSVIEVIKDLQQHVGIKTKILMHSLKGKQYYEPHEHL